MLFTNLHSTSPTIENNLIINKLTCGLCPSTDRIQDDEGDTSKSCWVLLVFNPFALSPSIRRYKLIHNLFEKFLMKFSIPHLWAEKRVKNIDFTSPSQHNMRKCFRLVAFDSQATAQLDCSVNFWINGLVSWKISHLLDFFFSLARSKVDNGSIKNVENRLSFSHISIARLYEFGSTNLSGMWKS